MTKPIHYIENGTFPLDDYKALMSAAQGCRTALEFGPGHSTRALMDAGVKFIRSYESDPRWAHKAQVSLAGLARHLSIDFKILPYENEPELKLVNPAPAIKGLYDIAIVDAPKGGARHAELPGQKGLSRFNTLSYALRNAQRVLLHDCDREGERRSIKAAGCKNIVCLTEKLWIVQDG